MTNDCDPPIKVLYMAGSGRSGTTIMANLLGQAEGFVSVGEMYMMWETGLPRPNACGCGRYLPDCPFWTSVFDNAYGGIGEIAPDEMKRALRAHFRTRHYPLRGAALPVSSDPDDLNLLRTNFGRLYRSIAQVSGSRVIVDSSKRPVYGLLLAQLPEVELYVVHMVRDPRGVAYSWGRRQVKPVTGQPTRRMGPINSSLQWVGLNLVAERAFEGLDADRRYLRLKYEDFASRPKVAYRAVLGLMGESVVNDPFVTDHTVRLGLSHTMAGNRSRFAEGAVEIANDREWETQMAPGRKLLVSALTWPLLPRYGYPILHSNSR